MYLKTSHKKYVVIIEAGADVAFPVIEKRERGVNK